MFNENLLDKIVYLRKLAKTIGTSQRISDQLEILRYVRNSTLNLTFDQGLAEEDEWILKENKS